MADLCFLAEWYRPEPIGPSRGTNPFPKPCPPGRKRGRDVGGGLPRPAADDVLGTPDEMVFALFAAGSADVVALVCGPAGLPPERLTLAEDFVLPGGVAVPPASA
jgi:hypothetical protein